MPHPTVLTQKTCLKPNLLTIIVINRLQSHVVIVIHRIVLYRQLSADIKIAGLKPVLLASRGRRPGLTKLVLI